MRTIKDCDTRKQEIIEGAVKVFSEKGYDKTTISDIAKELNISQGLCYRYFESKEAIYEEAIEEYSNIIVSKKLEERSQNLNANLFVENLTSSEDNFLSLEKENPSLYKLFHSENNKKMHNEMFIRVLSKMIPHTASLLEKMKNAGEINVEDSQTTATYILFGILGMFSNEKLEKKERMEKMKIMVTKLLGIEK